jgi:hypothetical protein
MMHLHADSVSMIRTLEILIRGAGLTRLHWPVFEIELLI